jgi:hypothetical protein
MTLSPRLSLLALGLALAPLAACTLVDAHADVEDVCVSYLGVKVPAAAWGATSIDQSFAVDNLGDIQNLTTLVSDLEFIRAEARATSGITDFDFVNAAHIAVSSDDPSSPLPTLDVYDCDGNCVPAGDTLTVPSAVTSSAIAYVKSGSVLVDVVMIGQPPTAAWTMDLDVCFRGQLSYQTGI